jgi:hypothetical protein
MAPVAAPALAVVARPSPAPGGFFNFQPNARATAEAFFGFHLASLHMVQNTLEIRGLALMIAMIRVPI